MKHYSYKKIFQSQTYMRARGDRPLQGEVRQILTNSGEIEALYYQNQTTLKDYAIVEVHGGGFMYNTARDDDDFCAYIHRKLGIPVISCNYRLAPQYQFPSGMNDVFDCVKHIRQEFNLAQRHIIIWGHSAGANLAAGASFMDKQNEQHCVGLQILDYPYMDVYEHSCNRSNIRLSVPGKLMDTFAHYYTHEDTLENPLVSPSLMSPDMLANMPSTYLLLCGRDNLNQGGKLYGMNLRRADVKVTFHYEKQALHGFIENHFNYPYVPPLTKLQNNSTQRLLAVQNTNHICDWILSQINTEIR